MESKKINQLATSVNPSTSDLAIIGDPITGVSKKITWLQVSSLIGTAANLQQVTDNGATTTNPITIGGLTISGLSTGVLKSDSGVISSVPFGGANGVATLGGDGKVPSSQLPSYVDDVVEVANYASLPVTGETGKIYITLDNNKVYRWTGSIYVEIAANNAVWGSITGTLSNQTDLQNALNAKVPTSRTLTINGTSYDLSADRSWSITESQNLITEVYNETGATLTKGTIVYINGGHGNLPTITKALATGDSTSAQTYGVVQTDITNNNNGYVVVTGRISNIDTQAYTAGTQLYLSGTTAGTWTSTKPYAPIHLVYVGIVVRSHPTQGIIEVKIQNGYELDELHNVSAQSPSNNDGIFYNTSTSLWEKKSIATALGYTPISGSGTTNYIPKFTGSNSVGNSTLQELSAGWLQLGSSSINTSELDIVGNTGAKVFLYDGYGSATMQSYYNDAFTILTQVGGQTTNVMDYNYVTKTLIFQTNGNNTRLNITSSGNIGIGNTNDTFKLDVSGTGRFTGQLTLGSTITNGTYTYTLPSGTGTLALTSDIPALTGYVPYTGATGSVNLGSYNLTATNLYSSYAFSLTNELGNAYFGGMLRIYRNPSFTTNVAYTNIFSKNGTSLSLYIGSGSNYKQADFNLSALTNDTLRTYSLPDSSGTIALTTDIPSVSGYVPYTGAGSNVDLGDYTLSAANLYAKAHGSFGSAGQLYLGKGSAFAGIVGYSSIAADQYNKFLFITGGGTAGDAFFNFNNISVSTTRTYTFPNSDGTIALTSDIPSLSGYVPTSRTLTINGTTYDLSANRAWTISGTSQWTTSGSNIYYNTGNVGIGTTTPTDSSGFGTILDLNGSSASAYYTRYNGSATIYALFGQDSSTTYLLTKSTPLSFYVNNAERMRITSSGLVGIGTSSPTQLLQVGTGTTSSIPSWIKIASVDNSTLTGVGAVYNNKAMYMFSSNTKAKIDAYDYGAGAALPFYIGGNGANVLLVAEGGGGNVGIGTTSPSNLLSVGTSSANQGIVLMTNSNGATNSRWGIVDPGVNNTAYIGTMVNNDFAFYSYGTERMRINTAGQVQVKQAGNTHSDGFSLYNNGSQIWNFVNGGDNNLYLGYNSTSKGYFSYSTGAYIALSDINKKKDFEESTIGLNAILGLKPTLYRMKDDEDNIEKHLGFIAQEVKEFIPQAYSENKNGDNIFIGLTEMPIIAALVKAIQELKAEIDELKNK